MGKNLQLKCYLGGSLLNETFNRFKVLVGRTLDLKLAIYADCHDTLMILEEDGNTEAWFFSHDLFSEFMYQAMMRDMRPI